MSWLKKYWSEIIRVLTLGMAGIILVIAVLSYSNSQSNTNKLLNKVASLTEQNHQLSLENAILLKQINDGTNSIHSQINCIVTFFSQDPSSRNSSSIDSTVPPCLINPSSSGGATGATKSG